MSNSTIKATKVIESSIDEVWRAWTDPQELKKWYLPDYLTLVSAELDLRVGGSYVMHVRNNANDETYVSQGTFLDLTPEGDVRQIVETCSWLDGKPTTDETHTIVTLRSLAPAKTEVAINHTVLSHEGAIHTQEGWEAILQRLEQYADKLIGQRR